MIVTPTGRFHRQVEIAVVAWPALRGWVPGPEPFVVAEVQLIGGVDGRWDVLAVVALSD